MGLTIDHNHGEQYLAVMSQSANSDQEVVLIPANELFRTCFSFKYLNALFIKTLIPPSPNITSALQALDGKAHITFLFCSFFGELSTDSLYNEMETGFSFGCFCPIWMIGLWAAPPSQHTHLRLAPPQWVHTPGAGGASTTWHTGHGHTADGSYRPPKEGAAEES